MSRAARFDLGDFEVRRAKVAEPQPSIVWPIPMDLILRIGESVMPRRRGSGRPHKGLDIFAAPKTAVVAASEGRVLRVFDGRGNADLDLRRAGLFVDILCAVIPFDGLWIHRYLHLWKTMVRTGGYVEMASTIALTGTASQVGIEHSKPHMHFEIRKAIQDRDGHFSYGEPIDPLRQLPALRIQGDPNV